MRTYKIAAMGGDGIGPEVVEAGVEALKVCAERDGGFKLDFQDFDWGSDYYKKHGVMMPAGRRRPAPQASTPSCSAPSARRTSPTTSRCGACAWRSASRSTNTPTCARPASCRASPARCATSPARSWTG